MGHLAWMYFFNILKKSGGSLSAADPQELSLASQLASKEGVHPSQAYLEALSEYRRNPHRVINLEK